nr:hypothetical protein [Tanacetum cinerariifolium]
SKTCRIVLWNLIIRKTVGILILTKSIKNVDVFTLRSRVWKTIFNGQPPIAACLLKRNHVCINGIIYWMATYSNDEDGIVSFDLKNEEFGHVCLQHSLSLTYVAEVNGSLAVVENYYAQADHVVVHGVWMMESVTKLFAKMFNVKPLVTLFDLFNIKGVRALRRGWGRTEDIRALAHSSRCWSLDPVASTHPPILRKTLSGVNFLWKEERVRLVVDSPGASTTLIYSPVSSSTLIYSTGSSTPPHYSPGASTPQIYSSRTSRNSECSNCKHLLGKITVLEATVEMYMHPEKHTLNSAALLHEVYNDMGKLGLE